jgi:hypothetical protein
MTDIDRPLNDDERDLLNLLTIRNVMDQAGCSAATAAAALDEFTLTGKAIRRVSASEVTVEVAGHVLVRAQRDWLAFHASFPDEDPFRDGVIHNG